VKTTYWEIENKIAGGKWEHHAMGGETAAETKTRMEKLRAYAEDYGYITVKYRAVRVVEQTTVEKW
jgi:hypothetical protein